MRKNRLLFIFALLVLTLTSCAPKETTIKVMSFNIRLSVADDGENSWENRRGATLAMLEELKPDLMGVQEAYPNQVQYIAEGDENYGWYGVGRDDGISKGEHMAIFYRKDRFELVDSKTFWLSETPNEPSFGWDAACRRTATYCCFKEKQSGKRVHYINTHLDHVGLTAQEKGLELIVNFLDSLFTTTAEPVLLTGDFNVIPSNPALKGVNQRMLSARVTATTTDSIASFNNWKKPLEGAALGDNLKQEEQSSLTIDYIYYKGFDQCRSFQTVTTTFANIPFISDHYPIMAELKF